MMSNATGASWWTGSRGGGAPLAGQAAIGCALTLLIAWTFLGNLAVCAAVFRYRHLRAKVTNVFIASLALSDLLVAALVMPWKAAVEVVGSWPFGASFCDTWVACDIMCSTASILHLCVIGVDRYWAISSPFRYERSMSKTLAFVIIGVTWTVSVVISFVPVQLNWHRAPETMDGEDVRASENITGDARSAGGLCDSRLSRTYAISSSVISFYIPVAVMIITYTRIYRIAHAQIRRISSLERAAERAQSCRSDAAAAENFPRSFSTVSAHSNKHTSRPSSSSRPSCASNPYPFNPLKVSIGKETKVLKTLSVIVGVFVCCWTPFFVLNCALPFCPRTHARHHPRGHIPYCVSKRTFDFFVWIGWSNSSLNPIIYAFNTDFRDAFLRLLGCRRRAGACACAETAVPGAGSVKQGSSLVVVSYRVNATRGSNDSGKTTTSDQVADTVDKMDVADNAVKLIQIGLPR